MSIAIVALSLVVITLFAALAIDLGRMYAERRQAQAAADSGALSGAYQMLLTSDRDDNKVFDAVVQITYDSLSSQARPSSLSAWRARWTTCTDPDGASSTQYNRGALRTTSGTIQCIRRSQSGSALRVRLPQLDFGTFFARVININTLSTRAVAEAGLSGISTGVMPFALSAGDASATVMCLKQPPNGLSVSAVCPGSTSGNFNYLAAPRPSWDSNQACNGGQNLTIQQNIAQSIDHNYAVWAGTDVFDVCTGPAVVGDPTVMRLETGNITSTIEDGFITAAQERGSFADGQPARLVRNSPCVAGGTTRAVPQQSAFQLEWCGVWQYMRPLTQSDVGPDLANQVPQACLNLATVAASQNVAGIRACFDAYNAGPYQSVLFDASLRNSNRYGWVPQTSEPITNARDYRITAFRPVFVQTIYYTGQNTFVGYDPGEPVVDSCPNCRNFSSITALVFAETMVPPDLRTPTSDNNVESPIALLK